MDQRAPDLACPKCGGEMRPQERQGIVIDLCRTCRGVFLDRGELDRLLDMEAALMAPERPPGPARLDQRYGDPRYGDPRGPYRDDRFDDDDDDDDRFGRGGRRRGFLADLLEGFGD